MTCECLLLIKCYNTNDFLMYIKYYLDILKFDKIVVYDNESYVDIKSICLSKDFYKKIVYNEIKGFPDQYNLYENYINNISKSDWVFPVDDDEYLYLGENETIKSYINKMVGLYPNALKFSFQWREMFTNKPIKNRMNESYVHLNTYYSNDVSGVGNHRVKTIVKIGKQYAYRNYLNGIKLKNRCHNPAVYDDIDCPSYLYDGTLLVGDSYNENKCNKAILYHFKYRTIDEWLFRINKMRRVGKDVANSSVIKHNDFYEIFEKRNLFKKDTRLSDKIIGLK